MQDTLEREDFATWTATAQVQKWGEDKTSQAKAALGHEPTADEFAALGIAPDEVIDVPAPANVLTTVGLNALTKRLITAAQVWDNTHVGMAIGNGATAEAVGNTDLSGASKRYNAMDATYPQQANGVLTFKATYNSGEAEFVWDEYGIVVADTVTSAFAAGTAKPAGYALLNRKAPAALGTKGAGTAWALTVTITIA